MDQPASSQESLSKKDMESGPENESTNTSSGNSSGSRSTSMMYLTAECCDDSEEGDEDEEDQESSEDDEDPETVRPHNCKSPESVDPISLHAMAKFREDLLKAQMNSFESEEEEESSSSNEVNEELLRLKRVTDEDDPHFEDAFPSVSRNDRLDTVEEVSEPPSSEIMMESLPIENEINTSMDTSSSFDFQPDSLPTDRCFNPNGPGSITSKEEVYSVTEIEISYSRELVSKLERKSSQKDRKAENDNDGFESDFTPGSSNIPIQKSVSISETSDLSEVDSLNPITSAKTHSMTVVGHGQDDRPTTQTLSNPSSMVAEDSSLNRNVNEEDENEDDDDDDDPVIQVGTSLGSARFSKAKPKLMREEAMQGKSGDSAEFKEGRGTQEEKEGTNNESGSEEDESLSVSLPSGCKDEGDVSPESSRRQRLQLAQVRSGILKILSEDEDRENRVIAKDETSSSSSFSLDLVPPREGHEYVINNHVEDGDERRTLDGVGSLNSSPSSSEDNLKFSEKHEFENAEKESLIPGSLSSVSSEMPPAEASHQAWSANNPNAKASSRLEAPIMAQNDNDSGIDRETGVTSRISVHSASSSTANTQAQQQHPQHPQPPTKMWSNFKKQVKRGFGGSTGSLSSPSPNSEEHPNPARSGPPQSLTFPNRGHRRSSSEVVYSPEVAEMESPREGGFVVSDHGLNFQSAAMMKKHIGELYARLAKSDSDKQKIADEAYRRAQAIKRDCDHQLEDARMSQLRQADLVEKLREKVIEYRDKYETSNKRLLEVTQVANQAQIRFKDTNEVLITLEERLRATEERRIHDIKQLQVKIEEEEEKNKTLNEVNVVLRSQLESASRANENLARDLSKISANFQQFKDQQHEKEKKVFNESQVRFSNDVQSVRELKHCISTFKNQFHDIKMNTEQELAQLKNELSKSSRNLTTACLNVYTKSGYLDVNGQSIHVGTTQDLYSQLEKVKLEKGLMERKNNNLEGQYKTVQKSMKDLQNTVNTLESERSQLSQQIEELKSKTENFSETSYKAKTLESHNSRLQNSLFDIAQIVLDDADKDDSMVDGPHLSTSLTRSVSKPHLRTGSPMRSRMSTDTHRRTRSASPAMMESTLTAVQAALNRRQLQIHDYRTKLTQTKHVNDQLSKEVKIKNEILESVEHKLDQERLSSDSMKIRLDEISREKMSLNERVELLLVEKTSLERSQTNLKDELESVSKEKDVITDAFSKTMKDLKASEIEIEHLSERTRSQGKDLKEKQTLIGQLEKVGSQLRDELLATKEELAKVKDQLTALDQEKSETDNAAANFESKISSTQTEMERFHKEEKRLKSHIRKLEEIQKNSQEQLKSLEDQMETLEEGKIQSKVDIADLKGTIETLKEEILAKQDDNDKKAKSLAALQVRFKDESQSKDKMESELKNVNKAKDDLENHLTSIQLKKDALEDEVSHTRKEMLEIKAHLERVNEENAKLNKHKSELEVRVEQVDKELKTSEERLAFVRSEKAEQNEMIDDLNFELSQLQKQVKELESDKTDLESAKESLVKENKRAQEALNETSTKLEIVKKSHAEDIEDLKDRHEKLILKLRKSLSELEEDSKADKEETRKALEMAHAQELTNLTKELEDVKFKLESENGDLMAQLERIKESQEEEMILVENEKQQTLTLAQQEQTSLKERIDQLTQDLEKSQEDYDKVKRESSARLEKDRSQISELQLELSRLKSQLEEAMAKLDGEKSLSEGKIRGEQKAKSDLESQVNTLKTTLKYANEKVDNLVEELEETRRKLESSEERKSSSQSEFVAMEKEIVEMKTKISRLERSKDILEKTKQEWELEKRDLTKKITEKEALVTELELRDYDTRKELDECREQIDLLVENNKSVDHERTSLRSKLRNVQNEYRQLEIEHDNIKERSLSEEEQRGVTRRESQQLRVRISELESIRDALERELVSAKSAMSGEEESMRTRISTLSAALEELRLRERTLEDQRHNLELDLADSRQEIKDLRVTLTGHEGKVKELNSTVLRLDTNKRELEGKLSTVCGILREVRSGHQDYRGSSGSPTRSSRMIGSSRRGRSPSPWQKSVLNQSAIPSGAPEMDEFNVESVRGNVRELMTKVSITEKERDDALNQVKAIKRQSDDLMVQNVSLEQQLQREREKILGSEEQLRKLEQKISVSDINLASQDEDLLKRERELKEISSKLEQTSQQLNDFKRQGLTTSEGLKRFKEKELSWNEERRRLQDALNDAESQLARFEIHRKSVDGDQQRLQFVISEKDQEIKSLRSKVDSLTGGVSKLEDKCIRLTSNVDQLNIQLERSAQNESDLQARVQELSRTLNYTSSNTSGIQEELEQLRRALSNAENEKKILEDRLESARQQQHDMKQSGRNLHNKLEQLEADLQRSESKANQLELQLHNSKSYLESNANDNYLKEELSRLRRESDQAKDKIRELNKMVSHLEKDKSDLERRLQKSPGAIFSQIADDSVDQVDHPVIRSQIPMMSSQVRGQERMRQTQLQVGEYLVKIRILEQENERLQRKIRGLETQLSELEHCHGVRIQELLQERRKEREKDGKRQKESLRSVEESLKAREKIYKERIKGLEDQVGVLKEQLSKEMRRRQAFITGTSGISSEMSELRQNLDQSLFNVSTPVSRLDGQLLDREAQRLSSTVSKYGEDHMSRLTPSRISMRGASSMENIHRPSSSRPTKRVLAFDHQ
ncbi:rootletin-like isoform X2 [Tigriopus californicus]|uniref:rootletin-like isoform X2 n=1 Tax=Tigriopus californicus TaxID=6832 RepID=UPI0027DA1D2E|nr:rootletin-like isoform X2 [Tigriopus californicus]